VRIAGREVRGVVIPPGVDAGRFRPVDAATRAATRLQLGLDPGATLVLGLSRLVPRKGFDVVIDAVLALGDERVQLAIAGAGRDRGRLTRRAGGDPNVRFLGRVPDDALAALYGCADIFAMCCRDRWGGIEAEGFGIVFLEAAACAVPAVAGRSGGAHEAVDDGVTGFVVAPRDTDAVRAALAALRDDPAEREEMGRAARDRAVTRYSYDRLVEQLLPLSRGDLSGAEVLPR
jgi:phosphatidylinositol alpha-1,6-mannosyltransferase